MMKNFKRLFTFLLLGVLLFSMALVGCGETLAETKEKGVEAIDTYMQEIRDMDLGYSLLLIEHEAEQGKQAIEKAEKKAQTTKIKKQTLNAMKALVLTDEEETMIKLAYRNIYPHLELQEIKINYFLGKFDDKLVAIIYGDGGAIIKPVYPRYYAGGYEFQYIPWQISVYFVGYRNRCAHYDSGQKFFPW